MYVPICTLAQTLQILGVVLPMFLKHACLLLCHTLHSTPVHNSISSLHCLCIVLGIGPTEQFIPVKQLLLN